MNQKKAITTEKAPKAIGPYSQAVSYGDFIFCSGQIPLDPAGNSLVTGDIGEQTVRVMANLEAVLEAAGGGLDTVLKTMIYLKDMGDFGRVNEVYGGYFKEDPPARACVQVSELPKGVDIEIEAIAFKN